MRQMYKLFYREKGIRYSDRLLTPSAGKLQELPKLSLFHYVPKDLSSPDVDTHLPYFQGYTKKILLDFVIDYVKIDGQVRKPTFLLKEITRTFRQEHRATWMLTEDAYKVDNNQETLIVMNYGYLDVVHKYTPVQMAKYHQWLNRQRTIWTKVNEIAQTSDRNQFIMYPIAPVLQGRTILDKFSDEAPSVQMMNIFGSHGDAGFMQLDLWKWIGETHRDKSLLGIVDQKHYGKVNLIFEGLSGDQIIVNLAYLNSWIKGQPNMTDMGSIIQYDSMFMQKLFLKFCMTLNAVDVEEDVNGDVVTSTQPLPASRPGPRATTQIVDETTDETLDADEVLDTIESDEADELASVGTAEMHVVQETKPQDQVIKEMRKTEGVVDAVDMKMPDLTRSMMEEIEKDIEVLDRLNLVQLKNAGIKATQEAEPEAPAIVIDPEVIKAKVYQAVSPAGLLKARIDEDAEANIITAADYRKIEQSMITYQNSEDPYGSKLPRVKRMIITPEDTVLTKESCAIVTKDNVPDKTMASSSLQQYDRQYLKKVFKKDMLQMIDSVQAAGVVIKRHEVDVAHSVLGSYEHHTLEIKPIDGAASTLQFTLPIVDEDGSFSAGSNKYRLRCQRTDLPLRKIAPRITALSTYYGKTFVQTNPKVTNDSLNWLYRQINLAALAQDAYIHEVSPGNVFDNDFKAPYLYNALAQEYEQFKVGTYTLFFNHKTRQERVNPELLKIVEKNGRIWCGWSKDKAPIVLTSSNHFVQITKEGETDLGPVHVFFQLDAAKCPLDFSEVRIFSKYIPVGIVLGYYLGFSSLIALLGESYRVVEGRKSKNLAEDEYAISFKDESYIFKTTNRLSTLILAGYTDFEKITKVYDRKDFEHKDVYLNLLMAKKIGAIYIREMDMMEHAFVDPISREILAEMKEPQTFKGLLVRGTELLTTYDHPASQDRAAMRDRGYERFSGAVYKELMQSIRQFRNKNLVGRSKVDMSPYQVWNAVMKDNSLKIVEDTNPIQNLKESEVVTYSGTGGRDKDTITKASRAYHKNDLGVLSESTVDSTAVGTIAYLSANPNISNVRGLMNKEKELNPTTILSTSALISPTVSNDLAKRIMFVSTQHSHTIPSPSYRQPYVRTGYEFVIGQRTSKMFCAAAQEDGQVTGMTERGMIVTYASGELSGIELGRIYGKAEGTTYPHDVMSPYNVGEKFKKGDILAYNTKFFEPDFLDPKAIILKVNHVVNTAFIEANQTHEDSCAISEKTSKAFKTEVTKIKSYVVNFNQNLLEVCKVGTQVEPKDILMIIEDEITSSHGQFSDDALSTLKRLSNVAPRAGVLGKVEKIEIFYHGDKQDMSATLKKLADKSDSDMSATAKSTNKPVVTGQVTEEYRVSGTPLELDKAEIRIYLTVIAGTGVGDKAVFGHQMKSTVAEVQRTEIHTESGDSVDATFSYRSVAERGVLSPAILGTTITLLDEIAKQAVKLYNGEAT